ncbi:MAG TPA: 2-oxoacid:acceptor oxidoreductase subunit alpha [Acidobacteriota bacterium]|nr:2-oxoglutarate ferredoxin oxidoreductase subunit alpha [Acidobacteriota bacterium]HJO30850.1 2-oxoacid:acceptor oxidoreductase subunit alpha [Acidobacteriota bacterium]
MTNNHDELAWRIGGPQGSGVDTAAGIFQRACALGGLNVFGRREYYSNIMGRHSYFDVRVAHHPVHSHCDEVQVLTTFEDEALARHATSVVEGGALFYSAKDAEVEVQAVTYLDTRAKDDLVAYLEERGLPATLRGLIEDAQQRGVQTYEADFVKIVELLADHLNIAQALAARTMNTLAVAMSLALVDYQRSHVYDALAKTWPGRQKIVDMNVAAVDMAYQFVRDTYETSKFEHRLTPSGSKEPRILLNGNQAVAMGKIAAGLTFQSYYPISPATDESVYLEAHETFPTANGEEGSVLVVQTEDEISAVCMAAGAALTGARSATATSGPGFALMVEGLGWAGNNEVPLVITLYQRGGPSTGLPTRSEQGDLFLALNAGHSEFPRIVLASSDLDEAFYDAAAAFNYAERYQTVVVHILDKSLSSKTMSVPPYDLEQIHIDRGEVASLNGDGEPGSLYPRFAPTESGITPRPLIGMAGGMHWLTGGEHTQYGRVTEDPVVREQQMEKRMRKLETAAREIPLEDKLQVYGDPKADFTVLSWGSNKGAIVEAIELLAEEGIAARLIQVRIMSPFPAAELEEVLATAKPLVGVEANFSGQLAQVLRQHTGIACDKLVVKYNGRPMAGRRLHETFKTIMDGTDETKIVLRNPNE